MKVELIARTLEKQKYPDEFEPMIVNNDIKVIAGKAAGICYAADDYLSEGIQDSEKALKRASFNAKSGHYSVFEHNHLTFLIECSKAMAMVLNSTRLYSTSEKSARYTKMHPETEFERDFYGKWVGIFSDLIKMKSKDNLDDKAIKKLAMENARYMTSVFTPTFMEFTIPSSRAILLPGWLDELSNNILDAKLTLSKYNGNTKIFDIYYDRIASEAVELADLFRWSIGEINEPTLKDHKNIGIQFFDTIKFLNTIKRESLKLDIIDISKIVENNCDLLSKDYYGDVYESHYNGSFASIAQIQRHRTTQVSINIGNPYNMYIPKIIRGTSYEDEWKDDYNILIKNNICPQAMILYTEEKGIFNDFVLKCKERLCARTQLETTEITSYQVEEFNKNKINLSYYNQRELENISYKDGRAVIRCTFGNYKCNEPCNRKIKSNYLRYI